MSDEYINRETLRELMYTEAFDRDTGLQRWDSGLWIRFKLFENCLDTIPAADVVEMVRCRECRYAPSGTDDGAEQGFGLEWPEDKPYHTNPCPFNVEDGWYSHKPKPDFFCAAGKRKDGGQEEIPAGPYDLLYEEGGPDA